MQSIRFTMIKHCLVALAMFCSCSMSMAATLSLKQLLQEERQWAGLHTKTVKLGDITWTYSEGGQANKPPILLLHGVAGSRDNWNRVASYLTKDYHVIIPDLPLHGDTKVPKEYDPQPAVMVDSVGDLMRHLKLKNVHVAGHSMGGGLATYFAAKYFYNVQSVFLVAPAGVYEKANTRFLKNPDSINDMLIQKPGDFKRIFADAMHKPPFLPEAYLKEQEASMIANLPQQRRIMKRMIEIAKLYKPGGYKLVLRAIEAPTLVVMGREDRIINVEVAEELAEHLKNDEPVVILDNVGHMPIMEAEQLVVQQYLPFLKKAQAWNSPFKGVMPDAR